MVIPKCETPFTGNAADYEPWRRDFVAHLRREGLIHLLHDDQAADSERQYIGFEMLRASVKLVQQFPRQVVLATEPARRRIQKLVERARPQTVKAA